MLSKKIKDAVMNEKQLEKALEILKPYKDEEWDAEMIKHLQSITPDDEIPIDEFSYIRK